MRCAYCGEDTSREWYDYKGRKISSFPFKCEYCGLVYCSEHRLPERHACPRIITEKRSWDIFSRFRRGDLQKLKQPSPTIQYSKPIEPQHEALSESTEIHPTKEKPEINEEQEPIETSWTRNEVKPIQHGSKLDYEPIPIHDLKLKKESKVVSQKCSRCNIASPLYRCDYCGNFFCDEHILPEDHACKHILEDKHERPIHAHAPTTQEEAKPVPLKNIIPLIVRLVVVWVLLIGLHQILWMNIHLLREYPILYRIVTGGEYVAILGVIVLMVLLYRHNKRPLGPWDVPKQHNKTNKKLIILIFLTVVIVGSTIPIYFTFNNQKMEINNLHIEPKEVISGSSLNIHVSVSKSVDTYLEHILNSLNDIVGYVEEIELKIDGKTVIKDEINLKFNENMNYVYPLLEKEPGKHVISVGGLSEEFEVLIIAKFEGSNLEIIPNNHPWIGENINATLRIENIGAIIDEKVVFCYVDNKEIGKTRISLNPEQSTIVSFLFCGDTTGLHKVSFVWGGGNLDGAFSISIPSNPVERPEYYYGLAKDYVHEKYVVPSRKDINGLVKFLDQIELPEYRAGVFDCSECSSLLEWLLEGAGFHAYICTSTEHAWVQVKLETGLVGIVAIESTQLTRGWGSVGSVKPWGIVSKYDGTYEELTYTYRREYQQFLDWKETYSSSKYAWDRNITFEEWKAKYLSLSISFPSLGIPSKSVYYSSAVSHELPLEQIVEYEEYNRIIFSKNEYDWWNANPYADTFPFSMWS